MTWLRCSALLAILVVALGLSNAGRARADSLTPLLVEISEVQPGVFSLYWRAPATIPGPNVPSVGMPEACTDAAPSQGPRGSEGRKLFRCPGGIRGQAISILYPAFNPSTPTVVRVHDLDGTRISKVLDPQTASWTIPKAETWVGVARDYTALGVHHILGGTDHLLFVACLLWIAGSLKRVLVTITGFTVAHSVSLALSVLQVVRIPEPPVEVAIALSILFLAREAAVGRSSSLTWRYPIVVSTSFGLLHGLGFAGALMEIGLPQKELAAGLLFFNVGVELGQIAFIACLVSAVWALKKAPIAWPPALARAPIYFVGAMAAYWTFENASAAFL